MSQTKRQLHLGLFLFATGYHPAGWRLPEARTDGAFDPGFLHSTIRSLEKAKFDFFFLGDALASSADMQHQFPSQMVRLEPFTMIANLAAVTENIGLIVTANTTYAEPYHIARLTASLDYLSGGRTAWNIVTGADARAALNFSREKHWDNEKRYDYADEFVGVVKQLWDTWEDEAFVRDKESGVFVDGSKVHAINHVGEHFSVKGPLNVARPPQGQLPLLSAGTSERSQELGARFSNVIFTGQIVIDAAKKFYAGIKAKTAKYGRSPEELFIMPGLVPLVGVTEEAARAKYVELSELLVTNFDLGPLSARIGIDLSGYSLDDPLPELEQSSLPIEEVRSLVRLAQRASGKEELTVRELFYYFSATARGHLLIVGDPEQIADQIEEWFVQEACDGFNICPPYMPGGLDLFLEHVVPVLQRRGLFRTEYEGSTFRSHFGLERPANQFAKQGALQES
ncbi:alkanesulfonate monooxygenase [Paenibacillus sp. UNCCL117]|uniref:LLM class flavin-dependent oxidoreductase n=1 Tax=unclassified Paenibacillus TaxID=185978 RepID=UPI0008869390|nr:MULTISPECIES: LLM class flavin-dependent oxidoreductase [unclassified Paenibacillus]SDD17014.1 alkanesulfonate monooxygenase [Paenibacillus sp. cl123]SFW34864.1 alkanesulfonate monooxygenase [Paenibacillus sp. UNCCL117]